MQQQHTLNAECKAINVIGVRKWVNISNLAYSAALNNFYCSHMIYTEELGSWGCE